VQHRIPVESLGATAVPMAKAVESCVHCGFCLPACPTYTLLGEEMDSPRGRILLMKEALEGGLSHDEVAPYVDRCLGCLSCMPACPSGVDYASLVTAYRGLAAPRRGRSPLRALVRRLALETIPSPRRFRAALRAAGILRALRPRLPGAVEPLAALAPPALPAPVPLPERTPAVGARRARVALLSGCAQQVLSPGISAAAIDVLAANGVEVLVPPGQGCCGALAAHTGDLALARRQARANLRIWTRLHDIDAIVTTAAGCGSGMHEYPLWLAGTSDEETSRAVARRTIDVSAFLADLGPLTPFALPRPVRVAYHDACHLVHAQRVARQPRDLLGLVAGLELVEPRERGMCCGSAGLYNLEQPDIADALGRRKAAALVETGAATIVSGNIGCLVQIRRFVGELAPTVELRHTIELLARARRS
jgi:glycolate oxidase iron-sulfur subunit